MISIRTILISAALLLPIAGHAGAEDASPIADVTLTFDPHAVALPDTLGDAAVSALVNVKNEQQLALVLVSIHAPDGALFARLQDPAPAGWIAKATQTTVEFVGHLGADASVALPLRILDTPEARAAQFEVSVNTVSATLSMDFEKPLQPLVPGNGNFVCQLVVASNAGGVTTFLPVASLSSQTPTSASLLVAVYDTVYRDYVDPSHVTGAVHATAGGASLPIALDRVTVAPFVRTPAGPVLALGDARASVRAAELWGAGASAARDWFTQHPGPIALTADVSLDGAPLSNCAGAAFSVAGELSPLATGKASTPFMIVPPEVDSDGDGFTNIVELRAGSDPLFFLSTPYTDDDHDGTPNGRDTLTVPSASMF